MKIWDKDGNVTERMVDLTKVDPENSDFIDMFAYSSYLESSGKCPGAQSAFMGSHANQYDTDGMRYDDLFDKTNWVGRLKDMMQMISGIQKLPGFSGRRPDEYDRQLNGTVRKNGCGICIVKGKSGRKENDNLL